MKRHDSIYLRIAAVLLLGLLAAQWTADRLYQEERERVVSHLISGPLGQRLDTVAERLDATPRADRQALLPLLNTPRITYVLAPAPLTGRPAGTLAQLQVRLSEIMGPRRQIVVGGEGRPGVTRVSFVLNDGQVVIASHRYPDTADLAPSRHLPLLTGYFLVIAVLALLAMRWAVRPLQRLARAADVLGRDLSSRPLAETGPREVRQAARAFNTMQNRLASYLNDRLHILAAVSHDLKTPITRLKLRSEMLPDPGQREKFLRDLDDMETMIAATLDFLRGESRQEAGMPLDINALLSTLCDDMAAVGGAVTLSGQAARPLLARPQALRRCLANLIDNAVRYGGGARIRVRDSAEMLTLQIDDDGPGLPPHELEALFEPFRRGETSRNRATGGVGLGLAIARNLARAHGGEVRLANRPEGGLRATVTLPRSASPA